ncbi:MAG: hypothetical protein WC254_06890 [Candidatus Woesearchaeota archaeon]|jgi:hypothetical protein
MSKNKTLNQVLFFLKQNYDVEPEQVLRLIKEKDKEKNEELSSYIPISLFTSTPLSSLEAITVYFREEKKYTFSHMAKLLGRNQIALSTSYRKARKKYTIPLKISQSEWHIPAVILKNRTLSVLEVIVFYLKYEFRMNNKKIADILGKDPRTIWTVVQRIKDKGVKL